MQHVPMGHFAQQVMTGGLLCVQRVREISSGPPSSLAARWKILDRHFLVRSLMYSPRASTNCALVDFLSSMAAMLFLKI